MKISRRDVLATGTTAAMTAIVDSSAAVWAQTRAGQQPEMPADLIVHNARATTLQADRPEAQAFAVRGERIVAVGDEAEVMRLRGDRTRSIDAGGRRVIPGLNDSHLHAIRGGIQYNLELRWDGVGSLARGLQMISEQAIRTPKDQWVRVMGGWSPYQFKEKRFPSVAELNDAALDTPVLVLFAYSQVLLNKGGSRHSSSRPRASRSGAVATNSWMGAPSFAVPWPSTRRSASCRRFWPPIGSTRSSTSFGSSTASG
jgi:hypothetical protein